MARQIEHGAEQVVLQSELVTRAGSALEAVDGYTRRVTASSKQISDIAMEQAGVASQVVEAIRELAEVLTQTRDSMEQARTSMDYLVDLAGALQEQIAQFRLRDLDTGLAASSSAGPAGLEGARTTRRLPEPGGLTGLLRPTDRPVFKPQGGEKARGHSWQAPARDADAVDPSEQPTALMPVAPGADAIIYPRASPLARATTPATPVTPALDADTMEAQRALLQETIPATPAITRRRLGEAPRRDVASDGDGA